MPRAGELPDLLTVDEAAAVLRIGRTKAYAMAREWRATQGRCGLPVLDLGNVLRVPRHRLEAMVGTKLHAPVPEATPASTTTDAGVASPETAPARPRPRRRSRNHSDQLTLLPTDALALAVPPASRSRP